MRRPFKGHVIKLSTEMRTVVAATFDTAMNPKTLRDRLLLQEDLNFLVTNRIPRLAVTRFMGWYSGLRSPLLTRLSIAVWRLFTDLDLSEARSQHFNSLQDCFTRELKPGSRPFDQATDAVCSPCDAVVGACGPVDGTTVLQAKGFPYDLKELLGSQTHAKQLANGRYITLRLTSSMYHRFHAPHDLRVSRVRFFSGDTWNVNPIALRRVRQLFCKNERAVIEATLADGHAITLVPVAAVLVASLRLHFLDLLLHQGYQGPHDIECNAQLQKGDEMGWFQHGSTIIVIVPPGFELQPQVQSGARIRCGEPLLRRTQLATDC
jgi:phosphatidylserine decarboxylase